MTSNNPLIEDLKQHEAFPETSISLPSSGVWYSNDMFTEGTDITDISIRVLGIVAEQNLKDPLLMLTGEAIPKMIKTIAPEILNPMELCEMDLEAILIASRIISYGHLLELNHTCESEISEEEGKTQTCGYENTIMVDLNDFIQRYHPLTDEDLEEYQYKLSMVDQKVYLRPFPYSSVIDLLKSGIIRDQQFERIQDEFGEDRDLADLVTSETGTKLYSEILDLNTKSSIDSVVSSIHCVESSSGQKVADKTFIKEWLINLRMDEMQELLKKINTLTAENTKRTTINYLCGECGSQNKTTIQLDANRLFTFAGDSKEGMPSQQQSMNTPKPRRIR